MIREPYTDDRKRLMTKLDCIKRGLYDNDPLLHINTGDYKKMKKAFDVLFTAVEQDRMDNLSEIFENLKDKAQSYINSKGAIPSSSFGKNRLELARDMRDIAKDALSMNKAVAQNKLIDSNCRMG